MNMANKCNTSQVNHTSRIVWLHNSHELGQMFYSCIYRDKLQWWSNEKVTMELVNESLSTLMVFALTTWLLFSDSHQFGHDWQREKSERANNPRDLRDAHCLLLSELATKLVCRSFIPYGNWSFAFFDSIFHLENPNAI